MKLALAGLSIVFLALFVGLEASHSARQLQTAKTGSSRTPVVVELFTSEGCSSCPPADALLAKLYNEQPVDGANVIALEEHVDYWDDQGWRDPFSSFEWTIRQQEYAEVFRSGSVYTPQMVVDGQAEFVGSRRGQSVKEIAEESRRAKTDISVIADQPSPDKAEKYSIRIGKLAGGSKGDVAEVWLAVAENNLQSAVTRGENAGEHLSHTSVLRTLRKIGMADADKEESFEGSANVRWNSAWKRENTRIIVFLQERKSRRILGAAEVPAA
jgi:hypothetical protein